MDTVSQRSLLNLEVSLMSLED